MVRLPISVCLLALLGICSVGLSSVAQQRPSGSSPPGSNSPAAQQSSSPGTPQQGQAAQGTSSQGTPEQKETAPKSQSPNSAGKDQAHSDQVRSGNDDDPNESSSFETRTDVNPPKDDAKNHPNSKSALDDFDPPSPADTTGVQEFHPWNPLKASKDVEVGDYYFRRKNYRAALERYKEALYYKENDAVATYRLAVCQEKMGDKNAARTSFKQYLKILPEGPLAKEARASIEKLGEKAGHPE